MSFISILTGIDQAISNKDKSMMATYLKQFCNFFDGIFFDNVLNGNLFNNFNSYLEVHFFISKKINPRLNVALSLGLQDFINVKQNSRLSTKADFQAFPFQYANYLYNKLRPQTNLVDLSFLKPNRIKQSIYGKPPKARKFIFPAKYLWQMDAFYWFEDEDAIYLSSEEKKAFKLTRNSETSLLKRPLDSVRIPDGVYTYIISPKGGLYMANYRELVYDLRDPGGCVLHHSSFRAGQPVLCAGNCTIKGGEIITINSNTGHYLVSNEALIRACVHLYYEGLIKLNCIIQDYKGKGFSIKNLMEEEEYQSFQREYLQLKLEADLGVKQHLSEAMNPDAIHFNP